MRDRRQAAPATETTADLAVIWRKARYGHQSILYWRGKDELLHYARYSHAAIKTAILAVGCTGKFFWCDGSGNHNVARSFHYMIHLWRCAGGLTAARAARSAQLEAS